MIEAKNIVKKYKTAKEDFVVLKGISLNVAPGEFVSITGRSGSGKSTLLYQLSLLDTPNEGSLFVDGVDTSLLSNEQQTAFRLSKFGYVFQDYALIADLTALENVSLPLLMLNVPLHVANEHAKAALERVGLKDKMYNIPSQLSGGQQQRVSIARAIAHNPKIIFADEPTANLDNQAAEMVLGVFAELNKLGQTIVMVTHELEYTKRTHRIITLSDGEIVSVEENRSTEQYVL